MTEEEECEEVELVLMSSHEKIDNQKVFVAEAGTSVTIAGKRCRIETEIVSEKIPLLLSKSSLKKLKAHIDMEND